MATIAESQAHDAWGILTTLASEGEQSDSPRFWPGRVTYAELAEQLGTHERALVPMLELIMNRCRALGLPPLTGLVVLRETGVPSDGFPWELTPRIPDICVFDWAGVQNPFEYARDG